MAPLRSARWRLALLLAAGAWFSVACNTGTSANEGSTGGFRAGATYPFARYLAGPRNDAVDITVDLDSRKLVVGLGSTCGQTVTEGTVDDAELAEGRRLFVEDRIAQYQSASGEPSQAVGGAPISGGTTVPLEEPEGGSGIPPDATPATPPLSCDPSQDSAKVWIYPGPGFDNVPLTYPAAGSSDPMVTEMLAYFEALVTKYGQ